MDALRSGHGFGPAVEVEVRSGPIPQVRLRALDPVSARWFSRVAARVYEPSRWMSVAPTKEIGPAFVGRWIARRTLEWPEPLVSTGSGSLFDAWLGVLRASPPGVRLRLRLTRVPPTTWNWWVRPPDLEPTSRPSYGPRGNRLPNEPPIGIGAASTTRPLFWRLRVILECTDEGLVSRYGGVLRSGLAAASRTSRGNALAFRPLRPRSWARPVGGDSIVVSLEELAGLWPSPECDVGAGATDPSDPHIVLPLGRTSEGSVEGPALEPHQGRHLAVLGETGMGKSSLLVSLARRALRDSGGVVFDPLGETVRALRDELGAATRDRCIWIGPDHAPVGLNALEGIGAGPLDDPVRSERRLNDLVHALRRVRAGRYTDSGYWGPRLEEMVTRALRAAAALPDGTLLDAHTLLATSTRGGRPIPSSALEPVRELADRIRDRPEDADGARRLLHEVVRSPVLTRMLCVSPPTVRTRDLVAPGRIVLISGDAARVGESTARYLLSVLLALVWSELLARTETPKTFIVLDEAQWFSHDSLGEMLRLGRRKNVHVVLATQAVGSLPESVEEAVWTNVSDFVAFRGSPEEAREFAKAAPGVSAEAILSLPRGHAAVLLGKGESVRWLRTARLPAIQTREPESGIGPLAGSLEGSAPVSVGSSGFSPSGPATYRRVLDELQRMGDGEGDGDAIVVDVGELRERMDPGGEGVRHAGSILARSGALIRVERTGKGRRWVIDRARLSELVARSPENAGDGGGSLRTQPS